MEDKLKSLRAKRDVFGIISAALMFGPTIYFIIAGFASGAGVMQKTKLGITIVLAIILLLISLKNKHFKRASIWVLIIGIYVCMANFEAVLLAFAITQILDTCIASPVYNYYKTEYRIAKGVQKYGD